MNNGSSAAALLDIKTTYEVKNLLVSFQYTRAFYNCN